MGPGPISLLILAAWLGLLAGFAELAAFHFLRTRSGEVWLYIGKFRHYPWTIPLVNAALFVAIAAPLAALMTLWPRRVWNASQVLLVAFALIPPMLVVAPSLYFAALLLLALGMAKFLVPIARRRPKGVGLAVRATLPVMLVAVAGLAIAGNPRVKASPTPAPIPARASSTPNVLLIVLDTVRADHLNLPGSDHATGRQTSPELSAFASRGVTFTGARATSPWTLPTHATLMTGRWPFEVSIGRFGAMVEDCPTLAETLGEHGFDTAGVVANTYYCSYYTGIDRGFAHYEDIPVSPSSVLGASQYGGRIIDLVAQISRAVRPGESPPLRRYERIDAEMNTRRFLDWLDRGRGADRPFFAFLNYFDAHDPYVVPEGAEHRFGTDPQSSDLRFLEDWWLAPEKQEVTDEQLALLIDGYDSCIAYLDEQIGHLLGELDRRNLLDNTIVAITSDHGEAFGEHDLFGHGISLYEDQLHVPLILVAPGIVPEGRTIDDVVSLRDLPATLLDLIGVPDAPLPGISLAGLWGDDDTERRIEPSPAVASVDGPDMFNPNQGRSPVFRGPMISITNRQLLKYIRTSGPFSLLEELYALQNDPAEEANLASPFAESLLDPFRSALNNLNNQD